MGYVMMMVDEDFHIPADYKEEARKDVVRMMDDYARGDVYGEPSQQADTFPWMRRVKTSRLTSLEYTFHCWRFPVYKNKEGDIAGINFKSEKIGEESRFFDVIAPYVEAGSFIEMQGEDNARWRHEFDGEKHTKTEPTYDWD